MTKIVRVIGGRIVTTDHRPDAGKSVCWHCCHAIDREPIPFPYKWDEKRNTFDVCGYFCSFPCMNAYNRDRGRLHTRRNCGMAIFQLYKQVTGKKVPPPSAPPRNLLETFGGHMTIDEFRAASESAEYIELPKNCTIHPSVYMETPPSAGPKQIRHGVNQFVNSTTRDTGIRVANPEVITPGLGYTPPVREKTMLETALGI